MKLSYALATSLAAVLHAPSVQGVVSSCMVVTHEVLTEDFSCDCTGKDAAIEVQGSLDLGGYKVGCSAGDPSAIVIMTGSGATLSNGAVYGGYAGGGCVILAGDHQEVSDVVIQHCNDDCVEVKDGADYATISGNWIKECVKDGIDVGVAVGALISKNRVEETGEDGIDMDEIGSDNATIADNYVAAALGEDCIDIEGSSNMIMRNEVSGCGGDGINLRASANYNEVLKNKISVVADDGIKVEGSNNLLRENTIATTDDDGIALTYGATFNRITRNEITAVGGATDDDESDDANGIEIAEGADGNSVGSNIISMVADDGIDVDGDYNEITNNVVEKTLDDLIDVDGNHNTINGNQLSNTIGSDSIGIEVGGNYNVIRRNNIMGTTEDCIALQGANFTEVQANNVKYCGDDGIEISEGGVYNEIRFNNVEACDVALEDETGEEDCGKNTWYENEGSPFFPECAGHGKPL